jgi:hypothetical protein
LARVANVTATDFPLAQQMPSSPWWLRVRHGFSVGALVVAPLLGLAWSLLVPIFRGSLDVEVTNVAARHAPFVAGTYLGVLMSFAMIPAAMAWGRLVRPAAPVVSDVATFLCAAGACFHGGVLVFQLAEASVVAGVHDHGAAVQAVTHLFDTSAFFLVLAPFILFYVGLAALAVILFVQRAADRWIAPFVLVAIAVELASPLPFKARLFFAMLTIAFAGVARAVWQVGAEDWAARAAA